jgi:hypothetical protein
MLSICYTNQQKPFFPRWLGSTYTEVLEVIKGQGVAEQVEQSILQHATVTVAIQCTLAGDSKNDRHWPCS